MRGSISSTPPTSTPSASPRRSSARPWRRSERDKVVLATKVHGVMGKDPNAQGNSRRWIMAGCENSLRRLGTDYIDLYQIHRPVARYGHRRDARGADRPGARREDPLLRQLDLPGPRDRRGAVGGRAARSGSASSPSSRRTRFWCAAIERDVLPTCQKYDMGVLPWSPLAGGWLSGAFGAGKENTSRRSAMVPGPL